MILRQSVWQKAGLFRHALVILVLIGAGGWDVNARSADAADRPAPRLVCEEPEFSFGVMTNTGEIVHDFVIRNDGAAPLKILQVKLPCGCMLLRLMDDVVPPGKQTTLRARFPLKGRNGPQSKRIILVTDDPARPRTTLMLTGEAVAELEIRPPRLYWGNLREDAAVAKTVDVIFHHDEECHVVGVQSSSPMFAAEADSADTGTVSRVKVRTVPPLPRGSFQVVLKLRTDHPRFDTLAIPMNGRVVRDLYTIPDELVLAPASEPVSRSIMVYANPKREFRILRVDTPGTNIEARIRSSLFSGCRVELRNLIPVPTLDGQRVVITTDYAPMKTLSVPIRVREPEDEPELAP